MRTISQQVNNTAQPFTLSGPNAFPILGAKIDNYTNQWLSIDGGFTFVAPYRAGVTISLRGAGAITLRPGVPIAQIVNPPPLSTEYYVVTAYDEPLPFNPGEDISSDIVWKPIVPNWAEIADCISPGFFLFNPGAANNALEALTLKAASFNTDIIYLSSGGSGTNRYGLEPGQAIDFAMIDGTGIWIESATANQLLWLIYKLVNQ